MKRLFVILLLVYSSHAWAETLLTKAFTLKHKKVEDAVLIVNAMLSTDGAVTIQPHLSTLVVQDREKNLRSIEATLAEYDTPPASVQISIKLVRAEKKPDNQPIADEIKQMARFGDILKYNQYRLIDSGLIETEGGKESMLALAQETYQIVFQTEVIEEGKGIIRLKNFQLKRKKKESNGKEHYSTLLSLTLNLRNAETLVLGASKFENSNQAVMIILNGKVKE